MSAKRYLLKLSGEALAGDQGFGHDADFLSRISSEIIEAQATGAQIAVVVGGGNIIRGALVAKKGGDRVAGDHMGMLGTLINAIALREALAEQGCPATVLCGFPAPTMCETFTQRDAIAALEAGRVLILAGGTGAPYFTTDTGAALRASELGADAILKATQVDGVYDSDPKTNPDAKRFDRLSLDEAIARDLKVMDTAALALARDNRITIVVFSIHTPGALVDVVQEKDVGTRVIPSS